MGFPALICNKIGSNFVLDIIESQLDLAPIKLKPHNVRAMVLVWKVGVKSSRHGITGDECDNFGQ